MKAILLALALSQGADIGTSVTAFHYGATELNPLIISTKPAPFLAQTTGFVIGEIYFLNKLSKHHPKLARTLGYVQIGGSSAAAIHNAQVIRHLHGQ